MQFAVGILMAFMIFELLAKLLGPIVELLFQALFSAVMVAVLGWIGGLVTLGIAEQRRVAELVSPQMLATFIEIGMHDAALACTVNDARLATAIRASNPGRTVAFGAALTGTCTLVLLTLGGEFDHLPIFNGSRFQPLTGLILTAVFALCIFVPVSCRFTAARGFEKRARDAVANHAARIRTISFSGLKELRLDVAAISELCRRLGVPVTDTYLAAVAEFVRRNTGEVLKQPGKLENVVREQLGHARADRRHLEQAADAYEEATRQLTEVRLEVARTRSISMFRLLDELEEAQVQLKACLVKRDWQAFRDGVDTLTSYIADVRAAAHSDDWQESDEQDAIPQEHADPYAVLRVQPEMSLQEIESVARRLLNIYHPDKGLVTDDSHFKQIQGAWEAIKAQRSR